jgi:hypothetical protein
MPEAAVGAHRRRVDLSFFFFAKKVFRGSTLVEPRMRAFPVEYSDFWLRRPLFRLHPRVGSRFSVSSKDWHCGKLYPVTAAQLFLIFTGFLVPDCTD